MLIKNTGLLLTVSAVLWGIWGLVHITAGVMTIKGVITGDVNGSVYGIADALEPQALKFQYPEAAIAVIGQHGFNLLWIGIVTFVSAFYVRKGNGNAIILAALIGGLADMGYFVFFDLAGYVRFLPGTLMTIVSCAAIMLSFYVHFIPKEEESRRAGAVLVEHPPASLSATKAASNTHTMYLREANVAKRLNEESKRRANRSEW